MDDTKWTKSLVKKTDFTITKTRGQHKTNPQKTKHHEPQQKKTDNM